MRGVLMATTALLMTALAASVCASESWVLWANEAQIGRREDPPARSLSVHENKAACLEAAKADITARRDRPIPPGVPAGLRDDFATEAGEIGPLKNGQGFSVMLRRKKTGTVTVQFAECWPVGVTPR